MNLETLNYVEWIKEKFPEKFTGTVVLEIGSLDVNGNVRHRKGLFENCDYTGIDIIPGKCVDIVTDFLDYQTDKKFDLILYLDAVEHDRNREKCFAKMPSMLKDDGIAVMVGSGPNCLPHFISFSHDNFYGNITTDWVHRVAKYSGLDIYDIHEDSDQTQIYAVFQKSAEPTPERPRVSLVAIVKDEEPILRKMLESVRDVVDEYIIVDTGSTDGTKEIIRDYGKLYERPFVDFVTTKNEALTLANGVYILFMDADERLYAGADVLREWAQGNDLDGLCCKITEGPPNNDTVVSCEYDRMRMWRNDGTWKFVGPGVHEVVVKDNPSIVTDMRVKVRHEHEGKHEENVSGEKHLKWLAILVAATKKDPNDLRAWFYLARTLRDLGRPLEAVSAYEHYLSMPNNFRDERWQAAFDLAKVYKSLGEYEAAIDWCNEAIRIDLRRAEVYNLKGQIFYQKQYFHAALDQYEQAANLPAPQDVSLFLNPQDYGFVPRDQQFMCLYNMKQYDKAENVCATLNRQYPTDARIQSNLWWCRTKTAMNIFMFLGPTPEPIYSTIIEEQGVGGVETTYLELSDELAKAGHNVFLFCSTKEEHISASSVKFIPYEKIQEYVNLKPDAVITSRWLDPIDQFSCQKILWLQDANPLEANYDFNRVNGIVVSSDWHKHYLIELCEHRIPKDFIKVIPLGIRKNLFDNDLVRDPYRVIYSSNPDRGLDHLADMWPEIVRRIPKIGLTVTYGWNGLRTWSQDPEWQSSVEGRREAIFAKFAGYDVNFTGRITKKQLAREMMSSSLLVYPCNFYETFCLTGLEAQASGTPVITTAIGALNTTVNKIGNILIGGSPLSELYQTKFIESIEYLTNDKNQWKLRSSYNRDYVKKLRCDWSDIVKNWINLLWGT